MKKILLVINLFFIIGCTASPYTEFYQDMTGDDDISTNPRIIQSYDPPELYTGKNPVTDEIMMYEKGYWLVGYSSFNAATVSDSEAISQAKKVHAHLILLYKNYTSTKTGALPWTTPDIKTTTNSYSGNVYGSSGSASFYGSGSNTTYGTKTSYIPYSVNRYNYFATFWVKSDTSKLSLGIHWADLTPEQKQAIGSNKGVYVVAVVNNTPAYFGDIVRGDIIKKLNGITIHNVESLSKWLDKYKGRKVTFSILRGEDELTKSIQLR